jgi:hypothetical protein
MIWPEACFKIKLIMAKKNVKTNKGVVEQPVSDVQTVRETTGQSDIASTTPEQPKGGEEKLPVQPKQSGGESSDDKGDSGLDSENKEETVGKEGGESGDQVTDNKIEETYREAKAFIEKTVDDRLQEKELIATSFDKGKLERCKKIASDVFAKHANCKVLYFTSDLIPFFEKSDAYRHAGSLKDDVVVTINKE